MLSLPGVTMVNRKLIIVCLSFWFALGALAQEQKAPVTGLAPVRQYIAAGWDNLTRSMTDCASVVDPKINLLLDRQTRAPRTDEYSIGVGREVGRRLVLAKIGRASCRERV